MGEVFHIRASLPHGGISKQPPHVRFPNQVEDALNVDFDIVNGLRTRNGTQWLARVNGLTPDYSYRLHTIFRDNNERYLVVHGGGQIKVFDIEGAEATVTMDQDAADYLSKDIHPDAHESMISIADYTLVCNTRTNTRFDGSAPDPLTMPVKMVRTAIKTTNQPAAFHISTIAWNKRLSGNTLTNKPPTIVSKGYPITDMAYHRSRLVLAGDEYLAFSQVNDLFNFFIEDAQNIVDSDPIDAALGTTQVTLIDHVVDFNKSLSIFTGSGRQFELNAPEALTHANATITPSTNYQALPVRPVGLGTSLYFFGKGEQYATLYEYFYDDSRVSNQAADVSIHIAGMLPHQGRSLTGSVNDRRLWAAQSSTPAGVLDFDDESGTPIQLDEATRGTKELLVYTFYWDGEKKQQSAWTKYQLPSNVIIEDIATIGNKLYLLIQDDQGWALEVSPIQPDEDWLLDRKVQVTGVFGGADTVFTLPYTGADASVLADGTALAVTPSGQTLAVTGDYSGQPVTCGVRVNWQAELTEPIHRDTNGQPDLFGTVQTRKVVATTKSGGPVPGGKIELQLVMGGRDSKNYPSPIGDVLCQAINGHADLVTLKLASQTNSSHFPVIITGIDLECEFNRR